MFLRISALLVWALAAASAVFWGMRVFAASKPLPADAVVAAAPSIGNGPLDKLLGVAPEPEEEAAAPEEDSRFKLLGVVAPRRGGEHLGVALIAVNDQPARPFRVGAAVEGDSVLLSVAPRHADLGPRGGPASVSLELPDPDSAPRPAPPPSMAMPANRFAPPAAASQRPMPHRGMQNGMPVRGPMQAPSAVPTEMPAADDDEDE